MDWVAHFSAMGWEAWLTISVVVAVLIVLAREAAPADVVFLGAVVLLSSLGVITPGEALAGFANSAVLMVGVLFVVAAALRETGVLEYASLRFLGPIRTEGAALMALAGVTVVTSAFLNNTPIVAILLPVVLGWCRKNEVAPSKLLIPLSFLTILGGACTLIGTSTNLVVQGLVQKANRPDLPALSFFEVGQVGLPCAIVGVIYILSIGRRLLPEKKELLEQLEEARREYLVEMLVEPGCRLVGQSVEAAGLRRLPGLFLIEIDRQGTAIGPVGPEEMLEARDRLVFTGVVSTIVDLKKIPGLVPAADATYEVSSRSHSRMMYEAVISPSSPLVGQTVREANFRTLYNAVVVAVHRNGERLPNKVGDIKLHPGDTLLLQAGLHFKRTHRNNPDFYLVSDVEDSRPLRHERAWIAGLLFAALIVLLSVGKSGGSLLTLSLDPTMSAFLIAGLMVVTRCISPAAARGSIEWTTLVTIAASFGLGTALEKSGAAAQLSQILVDSTRAWGPWATLAAIYFATMMLNELITNNGAAVLAFPFCIQAADLLHVSPRPFVMGAMLAASFAFASPIGYQTHMMVYGPGGYRFSDFVRVGLPLNLLLWVVAVTLIPYFWPF